MTRRVVAVFGATSFSIAALALAAVSNRVHAGAGVSGDRVVEIRVYTLKPGVRARFQDVFRREALPMLQRWNVDVVAYGPSLHDDDSFFLMRSYASLSDREHSEDAFYGSREWKDGPREAILAAIQSYSTVVVRVDQDTLRRLRTVGPGARAARP